MTWIARHVLFRHTHLQLQGEQCTRQIQFHIVLFTRLKLLKIGLIFTSNIVHRSGQQKLEYLPSQIRIHSNVMMGFPDYSFVNIQFSRFSVRPSGRVINPNLVKGQRGTIFRQAAMKLLATNAAKKHCNLCAKCEEENQSQEQWVAKLKDLLFWSHKVKKQQRSWAFTSFWEKVSFSQNFVFASTTLWLRSFQNNISLHLEKRR